MALQKPALRLESTCNWTTGLAHSRLTAAGPLTAQRPKFDCCASAGGCFGGERNTSRYARQIRGPQQSLDAEWKNLRPYLPDLDSSSSDAGPSGRSAAESEARSPLEDAWEFSDDSYTPFPSNLPTTESHSAPSGQGVDIWSLSQRANYNIMGTTPMWGELTQVYVILFGVGETETEGIYSLRAMPWNDALPQDTIIAFEDADDAERYAGLLEATMDHVPNVCPIEPMELLEFCMDSGYSYRLEPRGSLLIPPDYNVGMTDWERSLRLRDGQWSVLDSDPSGPVGESVPVPFQTPSGAASSRPLLSNNAGYYTPNDSNLDELKARLERLLKD